MTDKDNVDYESGFGTELKPSGFSVVTDSIARSRFEHFKRETSVDKLPSISKTSDDTSDEVETESDDEILFSGLSYVKFPDIQGGVGQPSKEQKYVKKMSCAVEEDPPRQARAADAKRVLLQSAEERVLSDLTLSTPSKLNLQSNADVNGNNTMAPSQVEMEKTPTDKNGEMHKQVSGKLNDSESSENESPTKVLDFGLSPGRPVDLDAFLDSMDLDDLLTRLEESQVNQDLLSPVPAVPAVPAAPATPATPATPGPRDTPRTPPTPEPVPLTLSSEETTKERDEEQEKGEGEAKLAEKEPVVKKEPEPELEADQVTASPDQQASDQSSAMVSSEEDADLPTVVASHPILDLWDEDDVFDDSDEEWLFLGQSWNVGDMSDLMKMLAQKGFKLRRSLNFTIPCDCYAKSGESGVIFLVAKSPSANLKGILHDIVSDSDEDLIWHVFHDSDYINSAVENRSSRKSKAGTKLLTFHKSEERMNAVQESSTREFACVVLSDGFQSVARAMKSLCCSSVLNANKIIEGDFPNLSLVAIKSVGVISSQDKLGLVTSGSVSKLSPLKRDRIVSNRIHRLESGAVFVLLFGMNATQHALCCLEEGGEEILGVVSKAYTDCFKAKHFTRDRLLQDSRCTSYEYKVELSQASLDEGLPVQEAHCAIDIGLSQSIYLESFLRNLGRNGFMLLDLGMCTTATTTGAGSPTEHSILLRARKKDAIRDMSYCINTIKRINGNSGKKISALSGTDGLFTFPNEKTSSTSEGREFSDRLRGQIKLEKLTCLALGPYSSDDEDSGQLFFDLSEVAKFGRSNGFMMEAVAMIDKENQRKAFERVARKIKERGVAVSKEGRKIILVVVSRDMALVKLQLLGSKSNLSSIRPKGIRETFTRSVNWIPKTKEECTGMLKLLGFV